MDVNTSQLIFDIDTIKAKSIYGNSYTNLYGKIKNYLEKLKFTHIQGSGYEINKIYKTSELLALIDDLKNDLLQYNFDLDKIMNQMHIGNIDHVHSLNYIFSRVKEENLSENNNLTWEAITPKRKQLIFDLDTIWLDNNLSGGRAKAYKDIKDFLIKNKFTKIEYSCYLSNSPIPDDELHKLINNLKNKYPYLDDCVKDIKYSNMKKNHSLNSLFKHANKIYKKKSITKSRIVELPINCLDKKNDKR